MFNCNISLHKKQCRTLLTAAWLCNFQYVRTGAIRIQPPRYDVLKRSAIVKLCLLQGPDKEHSHVGHVATFELIIC